LDRRPLACYEQSTSKTVQTFKGGLRTFMNQQALSSFIWSVADLLRGDYKQSDYGKS
jgi:hypothetical protein